MLWILPLSHGCSLALGDQKSPDETPQIQQKAHKPGDYNHEIFFQFLPPYPLYNPNDASGSDGIISP